MIVHILFVGLIAFVQNQQGGIDALLLDTADPQRASDLELFDRHEAFVAITKAPAKPCAADAANLAPPDKFCSWMLRHKGVSIEGVTIESQGVGIEKCDSTTANCIMRLEDIALTLGLKSDCTDS